MMDCHTKLELCTSGSPVDGQGIRKKKYVSRSEFQESCKGKTLSCNNREHSSHFRQANFKYFYFFNCFRMSSNISLNCDSIKYDIIIVGAGISGLVAATRTLRKESTLKLLILEASERCGGQILSGDQGELGAEWIEESHTHIKNLCEELNIQLISRTIEDTNLKRIWDIDRGFWSFLVKYELNRYIKYIDTISKNYFRGR